jgi:hypothetical protein
MIIRAIVEFHIDNKEIEEIYNGEEPSAEDIVGEDVQVKTGEYHNMIFGTVISAEEVLEVEKA